MFHVEMSVTPFFDTPQKGRIGSPNFGGIFFQGAPKITNKLKKNYERPFPLPKKKIPGAPWDFSTSLYGQSTLAP
jgi:hypothetical protein